jgi:hypothetical protein
MGLQSTASLTELRALVNVLHQKHADLEQRQAAEMLQIKGSIEDMKREHDVKLTNLKDEMAQMKESMKMYERKHSKVSLGASKQTKKRATRSNESSPDPALRAPSPKRYPIRRRASKSRPSGESECELHTGSRGSEGLDDEDRAALVQ